jgi:signal transduction histidine kinase
MPNDEPAGEKPEDQLLYSTAALRSLPNGVVICDRAGIVRFINPAGTRLLGVDIEQWLNRPHAVRDILWKLIDNACHYTLPNGQIQVRVERVGLEIRVDIVDTGIGISDAAKPYIFADFVHDYNNPLSSQAHYSHGVGMSLMIVRKLVELYGGSIWFESSVGQGSTFSFTLPISESV